MEIRAVEGDSEQKDACHPVALEPHGTRRRLELGSWTTMCGGVSFWNSYIQMHFSLDSHIGFPNCLKHDAWKNKCNKKRSHLDIFIFKLFLTKSMVQ